jgi:uncharacterized coiled-coil protein SlyX
MAAPDADPERERAMMRARLAARLEETRHMQERLEAAIERLDAGESTRDVRAEVEIPPRMRRDGFRSGGGGGPPGERAGERGERGGGAGFRGPPDRPGPDREAMLRFLNEHAPELAERLRLERERNPQMADRILGGMEGRVRLMMAEPDREMRDLRRRELRVSWDVLVASRALTESLQGGPDSPAALAAADTLRNALAAHFDVRLAMHEQEIETIEARLAQLRSDMQRQIGARDEMVDRRVDMIMRMADRRAGDHAPPPQR